MSILTSFFQFRMSPKGERRPPAPPETAGKKGPVRKTARKTAPREELQLTFEEEFKSRKSGKTVALRPPGPMLPRQNLDAMRADKACNMRFPTDDLYPKVTYERYGNLKRLRETLSIRKRNILPKERKSKLQLSLQEWKKYSKVLDTSKSGAEKKSIINKMTSRALNGDLRSFATLVNLSYHKDETVRDFAVGVFPYLYAKDRKLASALCTQAMSRFDPLLESLVLQERGAHIHAHLFLEGDQKHLQVHSYRPDEHIGSLKPAPKKSRFAKLFRSNRLLDEDAAILRRRQKLGKAPKTPPIIAMGALADGFDRRCVYAAHMALKNQKVCERLQISSPDLALESTRPISRLETEAQSKLYPRRKVEYLGLMALNDPNLTGFISRSLEASKSGPMKILTLFGKKNQAMLILHRGKISLMGIDRDRSGNGHVDKDGVRQDVPDEAHRQWVRELGKTIAKTTGVVDPIPVDFVRFALPGSSPRYGHEMFGAWSSELMRRENLDPGDKTPFTICRELADRFNNLDGDEQVRQNVALRLKLSNDLIRSRIEPTHKPQRTDLPPPPKLAELEQMDGLTPRELIKIHLTSLPGVLTE